MVNNNLYIRIRPCNHTNYVIKLATSNYPFHNTFFPEEGQG